MCNESRLFLKSVVENRLYLGQRMLDWTGCSEYRWFGPHKSTTNTPFSGDFGPMSFASLATLLRQLDTELAECSSSSCKLVYCVDDGKRNMTNAVFVIGAYMILMLDWTLEKVSECFDWLEEDSIEAYRNRTLIQSDLDLTVMDFWRSLTKSKQLGWIRRPISSGESWGMIDVDEYIHFDDPGNGDMHEVILGKIIAFRSPRDLDGHSTYIDDKDGFRHFSPAHFVETFKYDFDVTAVVQLNGSQYDRRAFTKHGISHYALELEDCSSPPAKVAHAFFNIVDSTPGVVAVHCRTGLGGTGTLIAMLLMRSYGFRAREAMGWLRIMRPGSVIGPQQHFLCRIERAFSARVSRSLSTMELCHKKARGAAEGAMGQAGL